jgi:hypothetical protein
MASLPTLRVSGTCLARTMILYPFIFQNIIPQYASVNLMRADLNQRKTMPDPTFGIMLAMSV